MVRHYIRKTQNKSYPVETVIDALRTLQRTTKSIKEVADEYNMKAAALSYHWRRHINRDNIINLDEGVYDKHHHLRVLSRALEEELLSLMVACMEIYSTICGQWIRRMAYEMAVEKKVPIIPDNWRKNKIAGKDWWLLFRQRHHAFFTQSDAPSLSVDQIIKNHKTVSHLFPRSYRKVLLKYKLRLKDVFILEICQIRNGKYESRANQMDAYKRRASTRGKLVTFAGTISAIGKSIPPFYIFSYTRYHRHKLFLEAPSGSKARSNPTGEMTKKLFVEYLSHVVEHVDCSIDQPILLALDDNEFYFSYDALKFAQKNGIIILTFPPRVIDKLPLLEVGMAECSKNEFGMLKSEEEIILDSDDDEEDDEDDDDVMVLDDLEFCESPPELKEKEKKTRFGYELDLMVEELMF